MEVKARIMLTVVLMLTPVCARFADHAYDLPKNKTTRVAVAGAILYQGSCSILYDVAMCYSTGNKSDCKILPGEKGCGNDENKCVYFATCESNTCKILPGHCGCKGDSNLCVNSAFCERDFCKIGAGHRGCRYDDNQCVSSAFCQHDICKCGGTVTSHEGVIVSTNYPCKYPENEHCVWNLTAPENHDIKLNFTDFNVEVDGRHDLPVQHENCDYDYLKLLNGTQADAPLFMTLCGQGEQDPVFFRGNVLQIQFVSDNLDVFSGFRIDYTFVARPTEEPDDDEDKDDDEDESDDKDESNDEDESDDKDEDDNKGDPKG